MLNELGVTVPTPMLWAAGLYVLLIILIADGGGGNPIFFPLFRPFMSTFRPRLTYQKLKSKYLVAS